MKNAPHKLEGIPEIAGLILGIDEKFRSGILQAFTQAHSDYYHQDKLAFVDDALQNEIGSDSELASRLGVSKSAVSNWRKTHNIRADKLDLLIAIAESHTHWPSSRDRYDRSIVVACEYCRNVDLEGAEPENMTLEQLHCLRLVLTSKIWSESVVRRVRDEAAIRQEAIRICAELEETGVQSRMRTLEEIDSVVRVWLVPYLQCLYVVRGVSAVHRHNALVSWL